MKQYIKALTRVSLGLLHLSRPSYIFAAMYIALQLLQSQLHSVIRSHQFSGYPETVCTALIVKIVKIFSTVSIIQMRGAKTQDWHVLRLHQCQIFLLLRSSFYRTQFRSLPCLVTESLSLLVEFCSNCWICQSSYMGFSKMINGLVKIDT